MRLQQSAKTAGVFLPEKAVFILQDIIAIVNAKV
jgi:hypothetical protein